MAQVAGCAVQDQAASKGTEDGLDVDQTGFSKRIGAVRIIPPSFRALSGRLKFTVRRHNCNKDFLYAPFADNT